MTGCLLTSISRARSEKADIAISTTQFWRTVSATASTTRSAVEEGAARRSGSTNLIRDALPQAVTDLDIEGTNQRGFYRSESLPA